MSTPESSEVNCHVRIRRKSFAAYRPLVELPSGRLMTPWRFNFEIDVDGEPGLASVDLDIQLVGRRYVVTRLAASPRPGPITETFEQGELFLQGEPPEVEDDVFPPTPGLDIDALR